MNWEEKEKQAREQKTEVRKLLDGKHPIHMVFRAIRLARDGKYPPTPIQDPIASALCDALGLEP